MICYLVTEYPKISHTFIRREIRALESLGTPVFRVAFRGWDAHVLEPVDEAERSKTIYLLGSGPVPLMLAGLRQAVRAPARFARTLCETFRLIHRSDRSVLLHVITLLEACLLSEKIRASGALHIHAHFGTNSAECAMLTSVLTGVSYSFTAHGPDEFDRPEFCHLQRKVSLSKFAVGVSSFGRGQLQRWAAASDFDKLKRIHCGLDDDMFEPELTKPVPGSKFVCVARFASQKGHFILIRAFAQLVREGIDTHLTLVGDGPLRPDIERMIEIEGVKAHVTLLGWADEKTVRREMLAAKALVMASYAEGLPVVFMEAMAFGRVVIATNVAGNAELVEHGRTGWLFPAGSVGAAADALRECAAASDQQIAQMGQAGRARAWQRHRQIDQARILQRLFSASSADIAVAEL